MVERIVPEWIMTLQGMQPVTGVVAHPVESRRAKCPIRNDMVAVEVVTPVDSRWFGVTSAWIDSDLRMHVKVESGLSATSVWEEV